MSKTRRLCDVTGVTVRMIRDKAIAVFSGRFEDTDQGHAREIWAWLPKSQIEVDPADYDVGDEVDITLPEWLAKDKELI